MLDALGRIANILSSELFGPLHNAIRVTVAPTLPRILGHFLGYEWRLRHSSTRRNGYHFLYSDFDFALILPLDAEPKEANAAIRKYSNLRRHLRFFGELEVYFAHEWSEKLRLESRHFELLNLVRGFRKQHWMDLERAKYTDHYHRSKADRAQSKIAMEIGSVDETLARFLTTQQMSWLEFFPDSRGVVLPFYGRPLPKSLSRSAAAFFSVVAVGSESEEQFKNHPLFFEKQIVHRHELLCYSSYYRASQAQIEASNNWMVELSRNLQVRMYKMRQPTIMPRYSLKEIGLGSVTPEWDLFEVELDLTERIECYLNESLKNLPSTEIIEAENEALSKATAIVANHNYFGLWLQSLYPQWMIKLRIEPEATTNEATNEATSVQASLKDRPSRKAKPRTLSMITPLSNRYGLLQLNNIIESLEKRSGSELTIELTSHELDIDDDHIAGFFRYSDKVKSAFVFRDRPSGVVILPTLYSLHADQEWLRLALQTGLPVVAGYGDDFETRVLDAMESGCSSIRMDFPYLKSESLAPH